jgi:sporulation and spore germination protein
LGTLVVVSLLFLPGLRQAIRQLGQPPRTEEQARREVMQPTISTPTDVKVKARMYWLSASQIALEPTTIELSLSADPVLRSQQVLNALILDVPSPEKRTLPGDVTLLAFYIQPDGTAIADFSDALASETPSGILNEQLTSDSIVQTLAANVDSIRQLKILIHGQEAETLAGHLDLSALYPVPFAPDAAAPSAPSRGATTVDSPRPGAKIQAPPAKAK